MVVVPGEDWVGWLLVSLEGRGGLYGSGLLLWPNLAGLEEAPTTAKCLEEKNVLMDASVVMVGGFEMG